MKAKTITLTMLALFLIMGTARTSGQIFSLGAKAGTGISYLANFEKGAEDITRSPNVMVQGGMIGNIKFTKFIGLQFEILYQQNGEKYNMTLGSILPLEMKLYMNYLTVPILAEFSHSFGNMNIFGGLGPYFGYALNGKTIYGGEKDKIEFGKDKFRRFDIGASGDIGVGYKVGSGNIFFDLRYNYGFMDINQIQDKPEGYKPHCNRNFGIYLGYVIPLGKKSK